MSVDLHSHTTASDGTLSPRRLIKRAVRRGVRVLSITDHDTTSGLPEAREEAARWSIDLIPGIEINTLFGQSEAHILGYFIDPEHAGLQRSLATIQMARATRVQSILALLRTLDVEITEADVARFAHGQSVGRPHVAQALVHKKYASHVGDAFDRYLGQERPAYVPRASLTPQQAIHLIREAGGVPVLAHPLYVGGEEAIAPLIAVGLGGLEVKYPQHSAAQRDMYRSIAARHGLAVTGGSDFHGKQVKRIDVGEIDFSMSDLRDLCEHVGREVPRLARRGAA